MTLWDSLIEIPSVFSRIFFVVAILIWVLHGISERFFSVDLIGWLKPFNTAVNHSWSMFWGLLVMLVFGMSILASEITETLRANKVLSDRGIDHEAFSFDTWISENTAMLSWVLVPLVLSSILLLSRLLMAVQREFYKNALRKTIDERDATVRTIGFTAFFAYISLEFVPL